MRIKIDWTNHLIELLVVFIGITAAFMLNNWREEHKDRQLEEKYLSSFRSDLVADSELLQTILPANKDKLIRISEFVKGVMAKDGWPVDSAVVMLGLMMSSHSFDQKRTTYESIINSGNLGILSDHDLRKDLVEYYEGFEEVRVKERIYFDWQNTYIIPFIYENMDITGQKIISKQAVKDHRFKNLVIGYFALLKQNMEVYKTVRDSNDSLLAHLK